MLSTISHIRALGFAGVLFAAGCGGSTEPAPPATGATNGRELVTLSNQENHPFAVTVDSSWVYWVDHPSGKSIIKRSAKTGGGAVELATTSATTDLVTNDSHVYFMDQGNPYVDPPVPNRLFRSSLAGTPGTPELLHTSPSIGDHAFMALALDSVHVYAADILGNALVKIPLAGGAATSLTNADVFPIDLVLDRGFAYFSGMIDRSVRRLNVSGPRDQTIEQVLPDVNSFAVHSGHIYYPVSTGIFRAPLDGGSSLQLTHANGLIVDAIAVDDSGVYYSEWGSAKGDIHRVPLAGGDVETLYDGDTPVTDISLDSSFVYFLSEASSGRGLVQKLAK